MSIIQVMKGLPFQTTNFSFIFRITLQKKRLQIPIVKTQLYTLDEIFEKNLLFLIPFYIFCYEKQFPTYNTDKEKLEALKHEFLKIRTRLDDLCSHEQITEYEKCSIVELSQIVISKIALHYEQVQKGVCATMGGKVLDYEAKRILNRGIDEGRREGLRLGEIKGHHDGKVEVLVDLTKDGLLSISEAAKRLGMDEAEFKKYL